MTGVNAKPSGASTGSFVISPGEVAAVATDRIARASTSGCRAEPKSGPI
jgi:hypothetical protein